METPLISVIVPIYKVEKYLNGCIESITNQTYDKLEIILVDDGSPDNCPSICDEWAERDSRIRVVHKANGGVSSARNEGLDNAHGDYITFVDGDDMIEEDMYELLVSDTVKNDTDISKCTFRYLDDDNNEIKKDIALFKEEATCFTADELCREYFESCKGDLVSFCNMIVKRELFNGLRFPEGRVFEDWTLAPLIYSKANKICFLPYKKYKYVIHSGSAVRTRSVKTYHDCVLADIDHYNYFNSLGNGSYNSDIINFMKSDFFKCCKVYTPTKLNRAMIKAAYNSCQPILKNRRVTFMYVFRNVVSLVYRLRCMVK